MIELTFRSCMGVSLKDGALAERQAKATSPREDALLVHRWSDGLGDGVGLIGFYGRLYNAGTGVKFGRAARKQIFGTSPCHFVAILLA